jgi:ABC-2 type transport system permease protein
VIELLLAEFHRFRWRRAVVLLLICCAAVPVLTLASVTWETRPVSQDEVAQAQQQVDEAQQQASVRRELKLCRRDPERFLGVDASAAGDCESFLGLTVDNYLSRPRLSVADEARGSALSVLAFATALLVISGATFAGADWSRGTISNQLLYEPRRVRVWTAKALIVLGAGLVMTALTMAGYLGGLVVLAEIRGLTGSRPPIGELTGLVGRGSLLAAAAAVTAYALTMLLRSTGATLGILLAVGVLGTFVAAIIPGEIGGRWGLGNNLLAVVLNGVDYFIGPPQDCGLTGDGCSDESRELSLGSAVRYLGTVVVVTVLASIVSFRARDIP